MRHTEVESTVRTAAAKSRGAQAGVAMLETVIVLPLLLIILFGIFEFGLAFARIQVLENAVREGARQASLFRKECKGDLVGSAAKETVFQMSERLGMTRSGLTVNVRDACLTNSSVEVDVTFQHHLPVIHGLARLIGGAGIAADLPLRAQARMLNETRS